MRLIDKDLNLLVAFDALMRECHVTRAAHLLDISQSSMSLALAKLRVMFHDPLLIKSGNGLIPTARAIELTPMVEKILQSVDMVIHEKAPFVPSLATESIKIIVIDYIDFVVMPRLIDELRRNAPNVSLKVINPNPLRLGEMMSRGDIDMALTYFPKPPENVRTRSLFSDKLVGIARIGHPLFERALTLDQFCDLGHIGIEPSEGAKMYNELVDIPLQRAGKGRRIALSKQTFLGVPFVVGQTDLVATIPEKVAHRLAGITSIRTFNPPIEVAPIQVVLMWHDRTHTNPFHIWLRELIAMVSSDLS